MTCRRALLWLWACLTVLAGPVLSAPAAECPSGGPEDQQVFVASDSNCAQFYLCSNGVPTLLTCPGDLYFNPSTNLCDYRGNVDCDVTTTAAPPSPTGVGRLVKSSGPSDGPLCPAQAGPYPVLLPNPSNCSTYYMCSGGVAVLMSCPPGLFFNNNTWTCDFPGHVVCPDMPEAPAAVFDDSLEARSARGETTSPSDQCPRKDGKYPVLLPNPDDCGSFYICSHGVAFLKHCPEGLLFNNDTWNCDYPQNVVCGLPGALESLKPISSHDRRPVNHELTFDSGCPAVDGKYPVFLPNPANCSTYYMCSHGVPYLYSCPAHLEFNSFTQTCDYPWRARCTENAVVEKPGISSELMKAAAPAGSCPEKDGKYPVFLANPANCSTYYMCTHGVPYLYSCPEHLEFNSHTNTCDFPWRARCTEIEETAETPEVPSRLFKATPAAGSCPEKDGRFPVFLPNPLDCSTYYMCSNGVPFLYHCPAHLQFDSRTFVCDFAWRVDCKEINATVTAKPGLKSEQVKSEQVNVEGAEGGCPEEDGKYPVLLPNPSDCTTFFMCSHGVPYLHNCPQGLYFNNSTWSCDFPHNVPCPNP